MDAHRLIPPVRKLTGEIVEGSDHKRFKGAPTLEYARDFWPDVVEGDRVIVMRYGDYAALVGAAKGVAAPPMEFQIQVSLHSEATHERWLEAPQRRWYEFSRADIEQVGRFLFAVAIGYILGR